MVFLLPASPAHAATATASLSTISSGVLTAATSGNVYSTIVISGSGWLPAHPIAITTAVGTTTVPWLTNAACASPFSSFTYGGVSTLSPAVDSLVVGGCLTTTASGTFQVSTKVPILPGGPQSVVVSDGTNSYTASYSVTPQIVISTHDLSGFPGQSLAIQSTGTACGTVVVCLTGFGSGDTVVTSSTATSSSSIVSTTGVTVGSSLGTYGTFALDSSAAFIVSDTTGGAKSITATDTTASPTLSTSVTFTVNPWVAFYQSANSATTFSVVSGTPLTSLFVEGHGFPSGTIAANSITVGGSATTHGSVTVSSTGTIGAGVNNQVQLGPPAGGFGLGNLAAVVDGITFSYTAGNIVDTAPGTTCAASGTQPACLYGTSGIFAGSSGTASIFNWGGTLIGSEKGTGGAGTAFITTDKPSGSYSPGGTGTSKFYGPGPFQDQIGIFGYGYPGAEALATVAVAAGTNSPALTFTLFGTTTDTNTGAFFETAVLGDTPYSNASPATSTATSYGITAPSGGSNPATINTPTFTISPWIDTSSISASSTVNSESTATWVVHGFGAAEVVTYTIGGQPFPTAALQVTTGSTGTAAAPTASTVPDLAGGAQNAAATGGTTGQVATATGAFTYDPIADFTSGTTLNVNTGGAGQAVIIRTQNGYGIHGLHANTAYNIVWNAISGSVTVGTFTSTATGGIPVPGTSFNIPSDSAGIHIIDIQTTAGASAIYGSTKAGDLAPTSYPSDSTAYGDLLFSNIALLQSAPSVAVINQPESLSGTGLSAGTQYVVALGNSQTAVNLTAAALTQFTATSAGAVPPSTTITLTDFPTLTETGTVEYFSIQTAAHFGTSTSPDAASQFVLASSASLNMTSAPNGHSVTISAHALNNHGAVYAIVFNYVQSPITSTSYTGTTVGIIAPNKVGAGSSTFNVPVTAASGTYTVQLVVTTKGSNAGAAVVGTAILDNPLSITVGSVSTSSCNTTSCLASGSSTTTNIGGIKTVQTSFTNNSNAPVTAIVYAVAHNALGQTVSYTTSTITASAGGSATAYNVLFGLAPGTYSVTIFATSTSGVAISTTSSVTVTI